MNDANRQIRTKGPWSADQIEHFLSHALIPVRIACNGAAGHPVLASLWFSPEGGKLWCATQRGARIVSHLTRDPRCAFEVSVESVPYRGIRGSGIATLHDERGDEMLRILLERYTGGTDSKLAKLLLARASEETAIAIEPRSLVSWDFAERMADDA